MIDKVELDVWDKKLAYTVPVKNEDMHYTGEVEYHFTQKKVEMIVNRYLTAQRSAIKKAVEEILIKTFVIDTFEGRAILKAITTAKGGE